MSRENLHPLVLLEGDRTLCCSENQDMYFIVYDNGTAERVDIAKAAFMYLQASKESERSLVWKRLREEKECRKNRPEKVSDVEENDWRERLKRAMAKVDES